VPEEYASSLKCLLMGKQFIIQYPNPYYGEIQGPCAGKGCPASNIRWATIAPTIVAAIIANMTTDHFITPSPPQPEV